MKLRSLIAVMLLCAMLMSLCACGEQRDITDGNANVYIDGDMIVDIDGYQLKGFTADAAGNIMASGSDTILVNAESSRYFVPVSDIAFDAREMSIVLDARIIKNKNSDPTVSVIPTAFSISVSLKPLDATCQKLTVTIPNDGSVEFDREHNNIVSDSEKHSPDMSYVSVTVKAVEGRSELFFIGNAEGPVSITVSAFDGHGAAVVLPLSLSLSDTPSEIVDGDDIIDKEELSRTDIVENSETFVANAPVSGFIYTQSAEIRRGPGTKYNVLETILYGAGVNILGYDGDWVKVYVLRSGTYGYVKNTQVDKVPTAGDAAKIPGDEIGSGELPGSAELPGGSDAPGEAELPGDSGTPDSGESGGIPNPPSPEPPAEGGGEEG